MAGRPPDAPHVIRETLRRRGLRLTGPRRAVAEVLAAERMPLTAAEIHRRLGGRRINIVSVYRTLHLLGRLGLIRVADTAGGSQRVELAEALRGHHHHLVCEQCDRVEDLDGCHLGAAALRALARRVARARKFRVREHDLKLFGLCEACAAR